MREQSNLRVHGEGHEMGPMRSFIVVTSRLLV